MITRIAKRIAGSLMERPDYGSSDAALPRGETSSLEEESKPRDESESEITYDLSNEI